MAMASIGRCVLDSPQFFILWGDITFSFILRLPENSLKTVMAYSSISATPPLVSTGLGALVGHPSSGPIGILLIYPVQKALTPNMLMPDSPINVCALLDSD